MPPESGNSDTTNVADDVTENVTVDPSKRGIEPNTVAGTLIVATILCLACSLLVAGTAVALRSTIAANKKLNMQRNVLIAAGMFDPETNTKADVAVLFKDVQTILINLPTRGTGDSHGDGANTINTELDAALYNAKKAAKDESQSVAIPADIDIAGIKRREKVAPVYVIKGEDGSIEQLVLPVYGKGLWSTLYGFLALDAGSDAGMPVTGITFYEHAETPGLGGEVDNPKWKSQWPGKEVLGADGEPILDVTKPGYADSDSEVDGLSGATITSNGVEGLVNYWLGDDAFGPFLDQYRDGQLDLTVTNNTL